MKSEISLNVIYLEIFIIKGSSFLAIVNTPFYLYSDMFNMSTRLQPSFPP